MASSSKHKTTMAKLNRERALQERRELKAAKKAARKLAAPQGDSPDSQPDELNSSPAGSSRSS